MTVMSAQSVSDDANPSPERTVVLPGSPVTYQNRAMLRELGMRWDPAVCPSWADGLLETSPPDLFGPVPPGQTRPTGFGPRRPKTRCLRPHFTPVSHYAARHDSMGRHTCPPSCPILRAQRRGYITLGQHFVTEASLCCLCRFGIRWAQGPVEPLAVKLGDCVRVHVAEQKNPGKRAQHKNHRKRRGPE